MSGNVAMDEVVMKIYFDKHLKDYERFYDHGQGRKLEALTRGTKLDRPASILCGTWKAASNTMKLPWLSVVSIESVGLGGVIDTTSKQGFLAYLPTHLKRKLSIPKGLGLEIDVEIHRAFEAYQNAEKVTKQEFNRKRVWKEFMTLNKDDGTLVVEFQMAIWGSQQISFGATYHAYENFLRTVIEMLEIQKNGKPSKSGKPYRINYHEGKVQNDLVGHLGQSIGDRCIDDAAIRIAKEIRNSLAHQGGYVEVASDKPNDFNGYYVIDNIIQITATKNRELFLLLQERAYELAEAALKKL